MATSHPDLTRRSVLQGAMAASVGALGGGCGTGQTAPTDGKIQPRDPGLIRRENARQGSDEWQLARVAIQAMGGRSPWFEGYCSHQSIEAGQTPRVMVSVKPACPFKVEIFRMGYYYGGRLMGEYGPIDARTGPMPASSGSPGAP